MMTRLVAAGTAQNDYLAHIAIRELEEQKERLAAYGLQAQFALATIYDRANGNGAAKTSAPSSESPTGTPDTAAPVPNATAPNNEVTPPSVTPPPIATDAVPTAFIGVAPIRFTERVSGGQP
jgi:hypothetical protein